MRECGAAAGVVAVADSAARHAHAATRRTSRHDPVKTQPEFYLLLPLLVVFQKKRKGLAGIFSKYGRICVKMVYVQSM